MDQGSIVAVGDGPAAGEGAAGLFGFEPLVSSGMAFCSYCFRDLGDCANAFEIFRLASGILGELGLALQQDG
jgi:hypothetical protein